MSGAWYALIVPSLSRQMADATDDLIAGAEALCEQAADD